MALLHKVDFSSDYTIFFMALAVFFIVIGVLLARVAPKKRGGRGQKFDDTIVDRSRELID